MTQRTLIATLTALTIEQIIADGGGFHYPFQLEWRVGKSSLEARSGYIIIGALGEVSYPNIIGRFPIPSYLVEQYSHLRFGISVDLQVLKVYRIDDSIVRKLRVNSRGTSTGFDELDAHRNSHIGQHENIKEASVRLSFNEALAMNFGAGNFGTEPWFEIIDRVYDSIKQLYFYYISSVRDEIGDDYEHAFRRHAGGYSEGFEDARSIPTKFINGHAKAFLGGIEPNQGYDGIVDVAMANTVVTHMIKVIKAHIKVADPTRTEFNNRNVLTWSNRSANRIGQFFHRGVLTTQNDVVLYLAEKAEDFYMAAPYGWTPGADITITVITMPAGLELNKDTWQITGTPTVAGQATIAVQANLPTQAPATFLRSILIKEARSTAIPSGSSTVTTAAIKRLNIVDANALAALGE